MKRISGMMLGSVLVLATVLAGCSTSSKSDEQPNAPTNSGSAAQTPAKTVTLKFYTWDDESHLTARKKMIDAFQAKYPNIKVEEISLVPGNSVDSLKKLDILMSSGEEVDIAEYPNIDEVNARMATGVLAPLDDFYAKYNIKPEEDYFLNPKYKGKYYAMMYTYSPWFVLINGDALKETGLQTPSFDWTWDDFREYAKKMTKGEGADKQYGAYFHTWGEYANPIAYAEKKSPYLTDDEKPGFMDPSFAYFFNLRRAMEKDDKSAKPLSDVIGAKLNYATEYLNGKAAMLPTATFMLQNVIDKGKYPHSFKTIVAPLPRSSKTAEQGLTDIGGSFDAIPAISKHKEEAFEFIRYMSTEQDARTDLSGYRKADPKAIMERLYGSAKDLIDFPSLQSTLFDSRVKTNFDPEVSVPYGNQLKGVLENGFSHFMLDNISAEEAQKWMMDEANKLAQQSGK